MIERAASLPYETGGYLIGRRRGAHIEVTSATFQGPGDLATRTSFDRADPSHTTRAVEAWEQDRGFSNVVGDWHSHPQGAAIASSTDEHAWRTLARAEKARIAGLVLGGGSVAVYVAAPRWSGIAISRCFLVEDGETELVFSDAAGPTIPF